MYFECYETKYLGEMLVGFQATLDRNTDHNGVSNYCRQMISGIAKELLRRYRQDTEIMNRKYANA